MEEESSVARKSTFIFAAKLAVTVFSWAGFLFIARFMGVEAVGTLGFALGFVGIFLQTEFGFGPAHNKMISEGRDVGECIGAYAYIKAILMTLMITIILLGIFVWESVLGHGYEDPMVTDIIYVILLYYILFSLSKLPIQTFGGLRKSVKQQVPELIGTIARAPLVIYASMAALGVIALAWSYVVTGLLMCFIGFFYLFRLNVKIKKPSKSLLKSYVAFTAPITVYAVFSAVSLNIDKVVVQFFWNATETGYFYGMQRVIISMTIISASLIPIFFPSISHFHAKKNTRRVKYLLLKAERYLSLILVPMAMVIIVLAAPIIHILVGDEFLPAAMVLCILSLYALFLSLNMPHIHTLYGCGSSRNGAKVGISIALSNTILLFLLVPREFLGIQLMGLGAEGAAIASLFSVLLGFILSRHYTRKLLKLRFNARMVKHWVAGMAVGLLLLELNKYIPAERWYELGIVGLLGLLCYLGILAVWKEFSKKDLVFFLDLLNLRKLKSYVVGELKEKEHS